MSDGEKQSGVLPTEPVTKEQTVVLVQSLLVTWNVLEHLQKQGIFKTKEDILKLRADGCCKPDGGTVIQARLSVSDSGDNASIERARISSGTEGIENLNIKV